MIAKIKAAMESLKIEGVHNEALNDCLNAADLGLAALEQHLTNWLWLAEGSDYDTEEDKAYAIQLGFIEENLVENALIYND